MMERTLINPWPWSVRFGFNQAELVEGHSRQLICSGQPAVDATGSPQHPGDMAKQLTLALDNLADVLARANMTFDNVVRLNIYTTDVDSFLANFQTVTERVAASGGIASTLVGVTRLAFPELLVEVEATAVA